MKRKSKRVKRKRENRGTSDTKAKVFCTECGTTLENFCFSGAADDLEAIRRTLAQCKKQGKFSGDFCSKLFIAHPKALDDPTDTEEYLPPTRH